MDVSKLPAGVMYTANGEWVVAEPDKASWDQFQAKTKASAEKAEAANSDGQELREKGFECPIDKRLFVDPVKTPCCQKTYCRDCIENALLENDFVCPGCKSENVLVDDLVADDETVERIEEYRDSKTKGPEDKEKSVTPKPEKENEAKSPSSVRQSSSTPKPAAPVKASTPAAGSPQATTSESKKRPAEEELDNKRIPTGPAAMRNGQTKAATPSTGVDQNFVQQMNAMAQSLPGNQQGMNAFAFPGMNGMPFGPMGPMMGMPMGPMMGMSNPMMMNGGQWGGMNGMGFPQNQNMFSGMNPMMNGGQWQQGNPGWNPSMQQNSMQFPQNQMGQGMNGNGGNDADAYFRKPVNPNRHQARNNRRQRSVDYREM